MRVAHLKNVFVILVPREIAEEMVEGHYVEVTGSMSAIAAQVNLLLLVVVGEGFFHVANVGENAMTRDDRFTQSHIKGVNQTESFFLFFHVR